MESRHQSEVRSAEGDRLQNTITLTNVPEGTKTVTVNPTAETEDTIVLIRDGNGDIHDPGSSIPVADGSKIHINSHYTLYVPENTENISLLPVTFSDKTEVKITFQKQNYSSGAPIPVKDGETIRVTGTIHASTGVTSSKSLSSYVSGYEGDRVWV